jgi:4-aminobutyrate aminotransferase/(S)-3-amino-2-methylpropionate transaminase
MNGLYRTAVSVVYTDGIAMDAVTTSLTNQALFERRYRAVSRSVGHVTSIIAARAKNSELWDIEGRRYIDFAGGIATLNTGHSHPKVIEAVRRQLENFSHTCFQVAAYEPYIALAERLNAIAPIDPPIKSVFFTTGAEATENAIRIARAATGRAGVVSFAGAFHGRTIMAMGLTGKVTPYKKSFGPVQPNVWHLPFPSAAKAFSVRDTLRSLQFLFDADIDPSQVAAIIIEPVQGEGGFHIAPQDLMVAIREICDKHGIVFIADEIQTGFGRTGKMFAMEHYGVSPDLMCLAKSLAAGLPLSAVVGKASLLDAAEPGAIGGTYAGNPLSCAAALAVLDVFQDEHLVARANAIGERLVSTLKAIRSRNNITPMSDPRGLGAMIAFDICREKGLPEADPEATKRVLARAHERGLIVLSCGVEASTIRLLIPLTVEDSVIDEGLNILTEALEC